MIIQQINPDTFSPNVTANQITIIDVLSSTNAITNAGVIFERVSTPSYHYSYEMVGRGLEDAFISYSSSSLDSSEFPIIKRPSDRDNTSPFFYIKIKNNRGESDKIFLDFAQRESITTYSDAKSLVAGSYAKYSWDRVSEIFSALDNGTPENHRVFDQNHQRRVPSIIPHSALTCHATNINVVGGHLRPYAITRRHCLQISHSGSGGLSGGTIRFRDVNNNIVDRTVIANINVGYGFGVNIPSDFDGPKDIRLFVLNEDLPPSISPAPFVGDWFYTYTGNSKNGTASYGAFGLVSFNQDTHICPVEASHPTSIQFNADYSLTLNNTLVEGREFGIGGFSTLSIEGYNRWRWDQINAILGEWYPDKPFHHFIRAGDSGSPVFWPVGNNRWAVGHGMISGSMWRPAALNALIADVHSRLGITGTYEVEVVPSPV